MLGAKYVAIGAVEILGDHVEINCRILQVATSENVLVEKVGGNVNDLRAAGPGGAANQSAACVQRINEKAVSCEVFLA